MVRVKRQKKCRVVISWSDFQFADPIHLYIFFFLLARKSKPHPSVPFAWIPVRPPKLG